MVPKKQCTTVSNTLSRCAHERSRSHSLKQKWVLWNDTELSSSHSRRRNFYLSLNKLVEGNMQMAANEAKAFSLWELIKQGWAFKCKFTAAGAGRACSPVANYSVFPVQLHWTSAILSSFKHHACTVCSFIFSRGTWRSTQKKAAEDGRESKCL